MTIQITTVSGDFVQGSFGLLPLSGDRARAALHFARCVGSESLEGNLELTRWYLRAALSEFRSIFDLLNTDFKSKGIAAQWKHSQQLKFIETDPIIAVLRKVRDFAIHSAIIVGEPKTFKVVSSQNPGSDSSDMPAIVFEPLDREKLAIDRGKDELSKIEDHALSDFNEQARRWPADLLIQTAIYRTSQPIAVFIAKNQKDGN